MSAGGVFSGLPLGNRLRRRRLSPSKGGSLCRSARSHAEYGSSGCPSTVSLLCLVERPTWETHAQQYSDPVLCSEDRRTIPPPFKNSTYTGCFPKSEPEMRRIGFKFFSKFDSFCGFIGNSPKNLNPILGKRPSKLRKESNFVKFKPILGKHQNKIEKKNEPDPSKKVFKSRIGSAKINRF